MQRSKRLNLIKEYVYKHKDVKITELNNVIDASESTIRRDIKHLSQEGFLTELYGSVVINEQNASDTFIQERLQANVEVKDNIGKQAASKVSDNDFLFIDAGSTTYRMLKHINAKNITVVTNGTHIAEAAIKYGFDTYVVGGHLKASTMAIVGEQAVDYVKNFNFDKCFMGTNGYSSKGYSTPDLKEGILKKAVIEQSRERYVLTDKSKQNITTAYIFAKKDHCILINE